MAEEIKQHAPAGPSPEERVRAMKAEEWKDSWFVVASEGDGAESVIVHGLKEVQVELTRMMWCGTDPNEIPDDIRETVAELEDADSWSVPYPTYLPMEWHQRFEDGGVSVLRLTGRLKNGQDSSDGLELLSRLSRVEELQQQVAELQKVIAWANNSLFGSHAFFIYLNGSQPNEHHLSAPIENLKGQVRAAEAEAEKAKGERDNFKAASDGWMRQWQDSNRVLKEVIGEKDAAERQLGVMREALRKITGIWYSRSDNKIVEMGDAVAEAALLLAALTPEPAQSTPNVFTELDAGHDFLLTSLDGDTPVRLTFVKRCHPPEKFPGNTNAYPGTTSQEVMRALIRRAIYVDWQAEHPVNAAIIERERQNIYELEQRAAERHGRTLALSRREIARIETLPICGECGHIKPETHKHGAQSTPARETEETTHD